MKYLKLYEEFRLFETYGEKSKFYHVSDEENLDSLLNQIDINKSSERGQGLGFYVVNDLKSAENLRVTAGFAAPSFKKCDLLIEIESILNEDNFDLDYELIKELPDLLKKIDTSKFTKIEISDKYRIFHVLVNKFDKVNESDFTIEGEEIDGMGVYLPKCKKPIKFGFYPDDLDKYQDAQNVAYTTYFMNTLDDLGIKSLIEKELFTKIGANNEVYSLRYVGPPIKPTRYKIKDESGNWSEWIQNK